MGSTLADTRRYGAVVLGPIQTRSGVDIVHNNFAHYSNILHLINRNAASVWFSGFNYLNRTVESCIWYCALAKYTSDDKLGEILIVLRYTICCRKHGRFVAGWPIVLFDNFEHICMFAATYGVFHISTADGVVRMPNVTWKN